MTADPKARPLGGHPTTGPDELEFTSQGHALLHIMEEVCQHLGQMEITRDLLRQRWRRRPPAIGAARSQGAGHPADRLGDQRR